jgi:hypothetical protein
MSIELVREAPTVTPLRAIETVDRDGDRLRFEKVGGAERYIAVTLITAYGVPFYAYIELEDIEPLITALTELVAETSE